MPLARLIAGLLGLFGSTAAADVVSRDQADVFIAFADIVSGSDPSVLERASSLVASPPTTLEEIGFYGLEGAPAAERVLRGIVSVLGNKGYLIEVEAKYLAEFPDLLHGREIVGPIDPQTDLGLMARVVALLSEANSNVTYPDFVGILRDGFWAHTAAMEAATRDNGYALMQLRLGPSDTLYFWAAPLVAEPAWSGRDLYRGPNMLAFPQSPETVVFIGPPDWEGYWEALTYSFLLSEDQRDIPPR